MKKVSMKRCVSLLMLVLFIVGMTVDVMPAMAATVKTTSIALNMKGTVKVNIGATLSLQATVKPAESTQVVKWSTSKKSIATVSADGTVTGKKAGTVTITATSGSRKAKVKVKVVDPYLPTSVKLDRTGTVKIPIRSTLTLTPALKPDTAKSGFTWKSSKKKVATVKNGVVTAKKTGTATIMVTTRNKKKAKIKVKVYDPYTPKTVSLNRKGTQSLALGKTLELAATLSPVTAVTTLTWKSSNKKVATVSSTGVVTPLKPGTAKITVTTKNKKKATVKVKVYDDGTLPITTPAGYSSPYVIYACKTTHTIAILAKDEKGGWSRVIRKFPTGMGKNNSTDLGNFFITKKERWHSWGKSYSPYTNKLSVGIFLHGPLYSSKSANTLIAKHYNKIGTDCSSGCLRTTSGCSAWVYYNCPVGTEVIIAQNGRFSASKPKKVSGKKDPTDPGANPEILITDFSVSTSAITLEKGGSQAVSITDVTPSNNSTGNQFTYSTGNKTVATVSASGVVTAVGESTTQLTILAKDDFQATVRIPITVTGGLIAGSEPVTTEKLEDDTAQAQPQEDVVQAQPQGDAEVSAPAENANETGEAASDADAPAEEETFLLGDEPLTEEASDDADEGDGLTIVTEEPPEESYEIVLDAPSDAEVIEQEP